ncbi:hypothetical protein ACM5Q9_04840 [Advenella sp. RU8]|uniref:hypothetical protein n=1 Tax=Advenella sp. RU8 TaxID=3399575 RepID=UPI003AAB5335
MLLWPNLGSPQNVPEKTKEAVFIASFDYYFLHEFCADLDPALSADRLEHNMQEDVQQLLPLNNQQATRFVGDFISSYNELVSDDGEYGHAISNRIEQFNAINTSVKQESCRSMNQDRREQFRHALKLLKSAL